METKRACCGKGLRRHVRQKLGACARCIQWAALGTVAGGAALATTWFFLRHPVVILLAMVLTGGSALLLATHVVAFFVREARGWPLAGAEGPAAVVEDITKNRRAFLVRTAGVLAGVVAAPLTRLWPSAASAQLPPPSSSTSTSSTRIDPSTSTSSTSTSTSSTSTTAPARCECTSLVNRPTADPVVTGTPAGGIFTATVSVPWKQVLTCQGQAGVCGGTTTVTLKDFKMFLSGSEGRLKPEPLKFLRKQLVLPAGPVIVDSTCPQAVPAENPFKIEAFGMARQKSGGDFSGNEFISGTATFEISVTRCDRATTAKLMSVVAFEKISVNGGTGELEDGSTDVDGDGVRRNKDEDDLDFTKGRKKKKKKK